MSYMQIAQVVVSIVVSKLMAPKVPDQFGQRLNDLKVQTSTYGNPIPIVYGSDRISGNVIWSADIVETSTTTGGGKGGGGGSQTTYSYSQSFAVAICEGAITGVAKIWANGELIYNMSTTADVSTMIASAEIAPGIRVYLGSEDQEPDSLIEAHIGAADTPAYRGVAYIVFENMQLANYGNRMPNLEFEIANSGAIIATPAEPTLTTIYPVIDALINAGNLTGQVSIWRGTGTAQVPSRTGIFNPFVQDIDDSVIPNNPLDLSSLLTSGQATALLTSGTYTDPTQDTQIGVAGQWINPGVSGTLDASANILLGLQNDEWTNFVTIKSATKTVLDAATSSSSNVLQASIADEIDILEQRRTQEIALYMAAHPDATLISPSGPIEDLEFIGYFYSGNGSDSLTMSVSNNFSKATKTRAMTVGYRLYRKTSISYPINVTVGTVYKVSREYYMQPGWSFPGFTTTDGFGHTIAEYHAWSGNWASYGYGHTYAKALEYANARAPTMLGSAYAAPYTYVNPHLYPDNINPTHVEFSSPLGAPYYPTMIQCGYLAAVASSMVDGYNLLEQIDKSFEFVAATDLPEIKSKMELIQTVIRWGKSYSSTSSSWIWGDPNIVYGGVVPIETQPDTITNGAGMAVITETVTGYYIITRDYTGDVNDGIGHFAKDLTAQTKTSAPYGARLPFASNNGIYYIKNQVGDPLIGDVMHLANGSTVPVVVQADIVSWLSAVAYVGGLQVYTRTSYDKSQQLPVAVSNGETWFFVASGDGTNVGRIVIFSDGILQTEFVFGTMGEGFDPYLNFEYSGNVYVFPPCSLNLPAYKISITTRVVTSLGNVVYGFRGYPTHHAGKVYCAWGTVGNPQVLKVYSLDSLSTLADIAVPDGVDFFESNTTILVDSKGVLIVRSGTNLHRVPFASQAIASPQQELGNIIIDICHRSGLEYDQIDVSSLVDTVHGYTVQRSTARSQIEPLMSAFYLDAVESDGKIKFVKRGGASVITIPESDLAAHEYGTTQPDSCVITRQQEMELPVEVAVQYKDVDAAYQVGTQLAARLTTDSVNKQSLNFAIAMTATKAKQIADVLMYDAWTSRTTFEFQTGWKYSYLEPTDNITIIKGGRNYAMMITGEDYAVVSKRTGVLEDATEYSQTGVAIPLPVPTTTVGENPITNLMLLDIPLLRDADDGIGFYAAAGGFGTGWTGAQIYKSTDSGSTWASFGSAILNEATIGNASTILGNFTQNTFDELNTVTVMLTSGELSSDTEINILNGANAAVLGNEIIQFKNATLTATNTYRLSGLLRGRLGTEWATGTHAIGDRFVLLSATTTYPMQGASSEYDLDRHYKGVTFGTYLDNALTIIFQNTAVQAIPYAPVLLGGGRNASGDITLNWVRRSRIAGGWNNYSDVPLGEATEAYVVEIYNNSGYAAVLRTITGITTQTTTYTAAQQITDYGSPQSTIYWKVYQVSATVGNGYEARGIT